MGTRRRRSSGLHFTIMIWLYGFCGLVGHPFTGGLVSQASQISLGRLFLSFPRVYQEMLLLVVATALAIARKYYQLARSKLSTRDRYGLQLLENLFRSCGSRCNTSFRPDTAGRRKQFFEGTNQKPRSNELRRADRMRHA